MDKFLESSNTIEFMEALRGEESEWSKKTTSDYQLVVKGGAKTDKVKERLSEDGWNTIPCTDSLGRTQDATFINEPNFYKTVLQSRKPQAGP